MMEELILGFKEKLSDFVELKRRAEGISLSVEKYYPIAVALGSTFYVFDFNESFGRYEFVKKHTEEGMEFSDEIRAAFPLDFYGGKAACVVGKSAFDTAEEMVSLLHEFVHCYQYETCENEIKSTLLVYGKSLERRDMMWEINYPFPYNDGNFVREAEKLESAYNAGDQRAIAAFYTNLNAYLSREDYEYMIWQEFKEGYARYIENRIRGHLNFKLNEGDISKSFDRVMFYETGCRHIFYILEKAKRADMDLAELYKRMNKA